MKIMSVSSVLDIILETGLVTTVPVKSFTLITLLEFVVSYIIVSLQGMLESFSFYFLFLPISYFQHKGGTRCPPLC